MVQKRNKSWLLFLWFGTMVCLPFTVQAEPVRWNVDPDHSTVEFLSLIHI